MRVEPDTELSSFLSLHFEDIFGRPVLKKLEYFHPSLPSTQVFYLANQTSSTNNVFKWSSAVTGMCIALLSCFVRRLDNPFQLDIQSQRKVREFKLKVQENPLWPGEMFNVDSLTAQLLGDIFRLTSKGRHEIMLLNCLALSPTNISISLNSHKILPQDKAEKLIFDLSSPEVEADVNKDWLAKICVAAPSVIPKTMVDEIRKTNLDNLSTELLELYDSVLKDKISKAKYLRESQKISRGSVSDAWLNLSHSTRIEVLNAQGDAIISVTKEISNLAVEPKSETRHHFSFEQAQPDVLFNVFDGKGLKLDTVVTKWLPNSRDIKISFPNFVAPLSRATYTVQFEVARMFQNHHFYLLRPRSPAKKISLEVVSKRGLSISAPRINYESLDGFVMDRFPEIEEINSGLYCGFKWVQHDVKAGEIISTSWTQKEN